MKPEKLDSLLERLSQISRRVAAGEPLERPTLTLHLLSGRSLSGVLFALESSHLTLGSGRDDLTHIPIHRLEAVTVHHISTLEQRVGNAPAPTSLDIRRQAANLELSLKERGLTLELSVPESREDVALEALNAALSALGLALEGLAADSLGYEALRNVRSIVLEGAEEPNTLLEGDVLRIYFAQNFTRRPSVQGWREWLEEAL
jgi:hypothetical protein